MSTIVQDAERLDHRQWTAASLRGVGIAWQVADLEQAEAAFRPHWRLPGT